MYVINAAGFNSFSIRTNFPPYQSNTPITRMPKNSLKGAAIFCLLISLLEKFKKREFVVSNFDLKNLSAKKLLIILIPLIVSSVIDVNSACSL